MNRQRGKRDMGSQVTTVKDVTVNNFVKLRKVSCQSACFPSV